MLTTRFFAGMILVGLMVLCAGVVSGQNYPHKPIRIVTTGVGGGGDFASRLIAQGIAGPLGQAVVIDNRPSGVIPAETVSKAPPDGYTLLLGGAVVWTTPLLQKTTYDPVRDFSPVTLAVSSPNILVVHPSVPVKSVKELIALAKARPGELNYSSAGVSSSSRLSAELFKNMTGVNIVHIPFKAGTQESAALISGEVQLGFASGGQVSQHIKSGRLRALAITNAQPSALYPGLPTVAASGLPGFESAQMSGIFAPAKTPEPIINRLNQEVVRFLKTQEAKEKFFNAGVEIIGSSPQEFAVKINAEVARIGKAIKDAGIRADDDPVK